MTKKEMIALVKNTVEGKLTNDEATKIIEAVDAAVKAELVEKGTCSIHEVGTFKVATLAARECRNPRTGETIKVGERKTVKFSPASALKAVVAPKEAPKAEVKKAKKK